MNKISPKELIRPGTAVYIENGDWVKCYEEDALTKEIIAVIPIPSSISYYITKVPGNITYEEFHKNDSIRVYDDSIYHEYRDGHVVCPNIIKLYSGKLYTTKENKLVQPTKTKKYFVSDEDSFKNVEIEVQDIITGNLYYVPISDIYGYDTIEMSRTLKNIDYIGTEKEQIYMRAAKRFCSDIVRSIQYGRFIEALYSNKDEDFIDYLVTYIRDSRHSKNGELNILGKFNFYENDGQNFVTYNKDEESILIKSGHYNYSDKYLIEDETYCEKTMSIRSLKKLLKDIIELNSDLSIERSVIEDILSFGELLSNIINKKLWGYDELTVNLAYYSVTLSEDYAYE